MRPEAVAAEIRAEIDALPVRDMASVRALRKHRSAALKTAAPGQVIAIARSLEQVSGQTGKWVAYELIRHHRDAFAAADEALVADFGGRLASWYAVDAFGTILAGPLWAEGRIGDGLIDGWAASPDRWLRRLALVATVGRNGTGAADPERTLALCLRLAGDRDDMVEKAVSWALRYLSQKDREAVAAFMAAHERALGARVRREVRHKLATGLKAPRKTAVARRRSI